MTYYNSLVAEKLKAISEIQRINKQIDAHKTDKTDYSDQLAKLEQLKTQLEQINSQILSYTLNPSADLTPADVANDFPDVLSAPGSPIEDSADNPNSESPRLLPE